MRRPVLRFALACLLFAGWMGYLIHLAVTAAHTVVVSRPQVLVADFVVAAQVDSLDGPVTVKEVVLAHVNEKVPSPGDDIKVSNLRECKRLPRDGEDPKDVPLDWTGPGVYLLPLKVTGQGGGDTYKVAEVPPSPGFPPRREVPVQPPPRIYSRTDDAVRQVRSMSPER